MPGRHGDVDAVVAAGLEPLDDAAARRPAEFGLDAGGVGFCPGQRDLALRGAGFEVAGRRLVDQWRLRLRWLPRFGIGDGAARVVLRRGLLVLTRLVGFGEVLFFFLILCLGGLGRFGVGDVRGALSRFPRFGARHAVAVGVIDGHDDAHPALDLGALGKAVGGEERGGGHAVAARKRVQGLAIGDHDRRAAGGGPADGRAADSLRLVGGRSALRRRRCGRPLRQRRSGYSRRRRGVRRLARERIGERISRERTGAGAEARHVGRTPREQCKAKPGQRETRQRASSYPRNAITHRLPPTPTPLAVKPVCADRVKGRFKINRR